jgi:oligopeptide transport system substrate-binding protein
MHVRGKRELGRRIALVLATGTAAAVALALTRSVHLDRADFAFANDAEVTSLDPATVTGIPEGRVSRFLFEGLCVHDPRTLEPLPGAAESWTVSPDGRAYTFRIRDGARWSNGDALTARDFAWSFERLLDPRTAAEYAYQLWCVKGARAFTIDVDARGTPVRSFDTVSIRAADERTLAIELELPAPQFLDVLAMPALAPVNRRSLEELRARFPDTWSTEWTKPEHLVVNGPYTLLFRRIGDRMRFAKNARYWDAEHVAFDTVDCLAVEHPSTALDLYLTGEVAWTGSAPATLIPRLRGREDFRPAPYLGTSFYRFNVTRPPLGDARVRRALALAIDRESLAELVAKAGEVPAWSFVPACAREMDRAELEHSVASDSRAARFAADVASARALLADAGYVPGARSLPAIEILYNTQSNNRDVAEVIADGWRKHLGLRVALENQEWKVYLDAQKRLDYQISRSSWIGDHPDPIGFLEIFTTGNENNRTGWSSASYDELIVRARAASGSERRALLHDAEALLMREMPIVPLYFFVTKNLVDPRLAGFHENALDEHSPKFWYWMDDEELAAKRAEPSPGAIVPAHRTDGEVLAASNAPFASSNAPPGVRAQVESHGPREGLYPPAHPKHRARSVP